MKLHRRLALRGDDEGFALLSVILLITVVTAFAITLLGVVLAQVTPTLLTNKNSRTLVGAQAGIDAAAGQFRNATSPDDGGVDMGDIHKLACVVVGTVDGTGGAVHYSATIQYFGEDPDGKDAAWRATNAITCYTGTGINGGLRAVPRYAIISSEGFDDASTAVGDRADRVIEATYTFQLTTLKVSGGMILDADGSFCLVADSATPSATTYIRYQPASDAKCAAPSPLNTWSWRDDYMIHLTSSDADGNTSVCLTGRATNETPVPMTLQKCNTSVPPTAVDPLGQRFSWTGSYTWLGQKIDNSGYGSSYIVDEGVVHTPPGKVIVAGDRLSVANSNDSSKVLISLQPVGAVGKGNASKATQQVVNQNQFGRCLDVTNTRIYYSYMIAYPCKQDPSGKQAFDWNHKWVYDDPAVGTESVTTQIKVVAGDGKTYCLMTASSGGLLGAAGNSDGSGGGAHSGYGAYKFPRFITGSATSGYSPSCSGTNTKWKRFGFSANQYDSYTFQDSVGNCLSAAGPKVKEDGAAGAWTSIVVETCNGKDDQKWNVPDTPVGGSIGDYQETTGH